jgi:hypothetical protein
MNSEQEIINQLYEGDKARFESDFENAAADSAKYALSWEDVALGAIALPQLEEAANDLIGRRLGYIPDKSVSLKFEPFLRGLIQSHQLKNMTDEEFEFQVDEHIKLIRNEDVSLNTCENYPDSLYECYNKNFPIKGQAVKDRLKKFMGYEPKLEYSIVAEMWMREIMLDDSFLLSENVTPLDIKAITLIRYREVLIELGKERADSSRLWGLESATPEKKFFK